MYNGRMKTNSHLLKAVLLSLVFCMYSGTGFAASPLDEQEWKRLEQGEVLVTDTSVTGQDGVKRLRGTAVAIVDTPPQAVWETIMDHDRFGEFMPSVDACRIVEDNGRTRVVFYELKIAWTEITYYLKLHYDPETWHVDGALDKSRPNKIADTQVTWDLEPLDGGTRTRVTYSVYLDSGRFMPAFVERLLSKRQLPSVLESVRNRAVSGGTWKK